MEISLLIDGYENVAKQIPHATPQHQWFLLVCQDIGLPDDVSLKDVSGDNPFGGMIGINDSYLDVLFKHFKLFRIHASFHDAAGYMKRKHAKGPGYCYMLKDVPINSCFLGHLTGLSYWLWLSITKPNLFRSINI